MATALRKIPTVTWQGCYDAGWKGIIVDDAFAHPAKFSYRLVQRIIRYGLDLGFWQKGDIIGDPFGGVGLGGIVCAYECLRWVGVELEPRFVELAKRNFDLHRARWDTLARFEKVATLQPVIVQGDSREFARLVGEVAGVVTSPPWENRIQTTDVEFMRQAEKRFNNCERRRTPPQDYGTTPGQIGALASGSLDAVLTSPPYGTTGVDVDYSDNPNAELYSIRSSQPGNSPKEQYGTTDGQIGNTTQENYWSAMHAVYSQMRLAMKPGAVAAIVVKDYVKDKTRVPICDQTCQLLEAVGVPVFLRAHALLTKEETEQDLFHGETTKKTERKSFFRRLAEKKGSPRIDWEEVLWCRK